MPCMMFGKLSPCTWELTLPATGKAGALCKETEEYLEEMLFYITYSGQSLARLVGDALLAFFGAPTAQDWGDR